jgi:hypothetical protein
MGAADRSSQLVLAWRNAARDLGFEMTAPALLTLNDGSPLSSLALIHGFGRRIGTLIFPINDAPAKVSMLNELDYFRSELGDSYLSYDRQLFVDTLNDWGYYGAPHNRPEWYSGKAWS